MTRTTKQDTLRAFERWLTLVEGKAAQSYSDVGGYRLDNNSIYGGVRIEQIDNIHGGVRDITSRIPPAQFVEAVYFLQRSLKESETNKLR